MFFDTHAHYDDEQFDDDRDHVLASMEEAGVELIVNPGADMPSSRAARELAARWPFVWFGVGVHPHDARSMTDADFDELRSMAADPKCVAVGEIGLDYHYDLSPRDVQKQRFIQQMELAAELKKPVIIHEREACADVLDVVTRFRHVPGVYHCFSGSWETARIILDQGWYLSFTGVITFKNARKALEVVEKMPADRLMIETDSPYLAPVPVRGRRNDSRNLPFIAARAAEIRGLSLEELAALTLSNGKRFFGIP